MPPEPCKRCRLAGCCVSAGLVNRTAIEQWLAGGVVDECDDFVADFYHGVEGVFA